MTVRDRLSRISDGDKAVSASESRPGEKSECQPAVTAGRPGLRSGLKKKPSDEIAQNVYEAMENGMARGIEF